MASSSPRKTNPLGSNRFRTFDNENGEGSDFANTKTNNLRNIDTFLSSHQETDSSDSGTLVPIWALAAYNVNSFDYSTTATGNSTSTNSNTVKTPHSSPANGISKYKRGNKSPNSISPKPTSTKPATSKINSIYTKAPITSSAPSSSYMQRSLYPSTPNPDTRPLKDDIDDTAQKRRSFSTGTASYKSHQLAPNVEAGRAVSYSTRNSKSISPHPTAVSSFSSPHRRPSSSQYADRTPSVISSTAGNVSSSGLYSKRRMATTPDGFSYIPPLHLSTNHSITAKGSVVAGSTFSSSAISSISSGGPLVGERFQNSYLLRGSVSSGGKYSLSYGNVSSNFTADNIKSRMGGSASKSLTANPSPLDSEQSSWKVMENSSVTTNSSMNKPIKPNEPRRSFGKEEYNQVPKTRFRLNHEKFRVKGSPPGNRNNLFLPRLQEQNISRLQDKQSIKEEDNQIYDESIESDCFITSALRYNTQPSSDSHLERGNMKPAQQTCEGESDDSSIAFKSAGHEVSYHQPLSSTISNQNGIKTSFPSQDASDESKLIRGERRRRRQTRRNVGLAPILDGNDDGHGHTGATNGGMFPMTSPGRQSSNNRVEIGGGFFSPTRKHDNIDVSGIGSEIGLYLSSSSSGGGLETSVNTNSTDRTNAERHDLNCGIELNKVYALEPTSPLKKAAAAVVSYAMQGSKRPPSSFSNSNKEQLAYDSPRQSNLAKRNIDVSENELLEKNKTTTPEGFNGVRTKAAATASRFHQMTPASPSSSSSSPTRKLRLRPPWLVSDENDETDMMPPKTNEHSPNFFSSATSSATAKSSAVTPPESPANNNAGGITSFFNKSALNWTPLRVSSTSAAATKTGMKNSSHQKFSPLPLASWENCLYVRADGARTGILHLTSTHLVFVYQDDDEEDLFMEKPVHQGLGFKLGDRPEDDPTSRGATPVNVPPDEFGEGAGVEVIGTDVELREHSETKNLLDDPDMYENGFGEISKPSHDEKKKNSKNEFSFDEVKSEILGTMARTDSLKDIATGKGPGGKVNSTNEHLSESTNEKIMKNTEENNKLDEEIANPNEEEPEELRLMRIRRSRKSRPSWNDTSPAPMSSSSSVSSASSSDNEVDDTGNSEIKRHDMSHMTQEFFPEESYEEMMNKCIIRAIEEEARRRLQELEDEEEAAAMMSTVASCSTWEREQQHVIERRAEWYMRRLETNSTDSNWDSFEDEVSLFCAQTNGTICSEKEIDEERRLYITGEEKGSKCKYFGIKWPLEKLTEVFPRRYMMKEVALEIYDQSPLPSSTLNMRNVSSSMSISTTGGNICEDIDVPLGPLSKSSFFLAIPDAENIPENERGLARFGRKKKSKPRRDIFVETLKELAPQLNLAHWQGLHQIRSQKQKGIPGLAYEGVEGKNEEGKRRGWTPSSLFRRRVDKADSLYLLTRAWRKGFISNFDYLLRLNAIAGRSFHDPGNYPIMPWVLSNYTSQSVPDLSDERNYRDLSKPMGALCQQRSDIFMEKFTSLCASTDTAIPPFMYGSHYSNTGGVVLHYLVRLRPFGGLHRQLQGGKFDVPDRLFKSVPRTWESCSRTSRTEVKELTPEWYSDPSFLLNKNGFELGRSYDGTEIDNVTLPPWAENNASKFIEVMRNALESDVCSSQLPSWIDLIFGFKQTGPEAQKARNVFYHLTYYEPEDLAKIEDEHLRTVTALHIADFGHCPLQLFFKPHPQKKMDSIVTKGELQLMASCEKDLSISSHRKILDTSDDVEDIN